MPGVKYALNTAAFDLSANNECMAERGKYLVFSALQADVEVTFSFAASSLDLAEPFDPTWKALDAQDVCGRRGSTVEGGGLGPFGLLTLASENLEEYTPVFFRVFKAGYQHVVLMCSDARRFVSF